MKPSYQSLEKNEPVIKGVKIRLFSIKFKLNRIFKMKKYLMMLILTVIVGLTMAQEPAIAEATNKIYFKDVWNWIGENWGWIASTLVVVSEGLGLTKKIKANSIIGLIWTSIVEKKAKSKV